jgi:hypothetical protein
MCQKESSGKRMLPGESPDWNEETRRRWAIMNEIEKRELIEQQRKIFEAGTQRVDKRTGSFSFLTWPFFLAPLIASDEFLGATFKSAAAEEHDAKATQVGAAPQSANDDLPASDPSKVSAESDTASGFDASSEVHAAKLNQTGFPAQSDEDAPKLSAAHNEAVAAASGEGGGGGGGDVSSVNSLSAASHFGSGQLEGGSTVEALQSNGLADLFSPSGGSAPLLGTVGSLSNDVVGGIAPVEVAVPPVLMTVTNTVSAQINEVAGAIVPVEAAVQPVLTTVNDTVATVTHDVAGAIVPVEAAVQPVFTTVTDTMGTLTHDVAGAIVPVEAAMQPALTTVNDTVDTLTKDVLDTIAPVEAVVQPALTTATNTPAHDASYPADTGNVAADALASAAPVVDSTEPVFASAGVSQSNPTSDLLHPAVADISADQASGPADTLLALATATDAPIEDPGSATAAPADAEMNGSNAAAAVHPSAIGGDVIALNDASPPPAHALFTGSQYTDYGVTLSGNAVPAQHATSPADAASTHDTSVPVIADVPQQSAPPPSIVDTTHTIDHLGHAML